MFSIKFMAMASSRKATLADEGREHHLRLAGETCTVYIQ